MPDPLRAFARTYRDAFHGLPREVWLLSSAMLVHRAGTMVLPFLALYLTQRLGFSAIEAGQVLGAYGLGSIGGAWLGGWLSDRADPVRVQQGSLAGAGAGFVALSAFDSFPALVATAFVVGVVADASRPALMSAATRFTPPPDRPRALALVRLAINLGMAIGPAIGGVLATHRYRGLFAANAVACWASSAVLAIAFRRRGRGRADAAGGAGDGAALATAADPGAPGEAPPPRRVGGGPWTDGPYLVFLALVTLMALVFFQLFSTYPLTLREAYRMPESAIGALLASNALAIVLFEMVLVRRLERRDPLRVSAWGGLLIGVGMGLLPLGPPAFFAVLSVATWTLGEMLCLPMTNVTAANRAPEGGTGRYLGAYTVAFSSALVLGPLAGTAVYERLGPTTLWAGVACVGVVLWAGFTALAGVFHQAEAHARPGTGPRPAPDGEPGR
jgi:predicted MFS family arabinose efflux permease